MQRTVRLTLRGQTQAERQIGEEADEAYEPDENAPGAEADADAEGDADAEAEAEAEGTHERTSWLQTPTASDSSALPLKADHGNRPLWVCSDGRVVLETFSPAYLPAYDFLITIAEPLSRPEHVHEYKLTPHSLYAAVSVGLLTETILTVLDRLSKTSLPHSLASYVRSCTLNYGKVKLVLQQNQFRVESEQFSVLRYLLSDPVISDAAVDSGTITTGGFVPKEVAAVELAAQATEAAEGKHFDAGDANDWKAKANVKDEPTAPAQDPASASACDSTDQNINHNAANGAALLHAEFRNAGRQQQEHAQCVAAQQEQQQQQHVDRWQSNAEVHSFAVQGQKVEQVKKRCLPDGLNYPMLEEYDFRNDTTSPDLPFELKPGTKIRDYQQKCLNKMFGNGRARSGIIVLPCGAGKTLAGVAAAARVRKSVLVLCLDAVSVDQWKEQFKLWSTLPDERIKRFTRQKKEDFDQDAGVCLTTYHMVSIDKNRRSETARKYLERISSIDWGLIIMDEVHVAPASKFRKVIGIVKAHCKLGLTATLVREDERVNDLNFLIGPKLYEADWLSLQRQGYIAKVQCAEVWCPMTKEFFRSYLRKENSKRQQVLYTMNPNKFQVCQFLMRHHEETRGDKVIIFSDNILALKEYAIILRRPYICGSTPHNERKRVLEQFRHSNKVSTIFLSKVGDNAIDLPEANVIIQISSQFGSRRQEAQRLGRILRPKLRSHVAGPESEDEYNAFYYSLVSTDTIEMYYSTKRQQFLVDQGYEFKVVKDVLKNQDTSQLCFQRQEDQSALLSKVLTESEREAGEQMNSQKREREDEQNGEGEKITKQQKRTEGSIGTLTGAEGITYLEYDARKQRQQQQNSSKKPQESVRKQMEKKLKQKPSDDG